jgi:glycosyltransferase involved in cell wall biosynthesis
MMGFLLDLSLILVVVMLIIALVNIFTVRTIKSSSSTRIAESVSILVPLRNEAENVSGVVSSLLNQRGLDDFEVIALDDSSTDSTREILDSLADARLRIMDGSSLPSQWLGKNFACHQLASSARGEILVFVDADVRLSPTAITSSITAMNRWQWDFISPYPRQIAITFLERVVQPLLQWSWFVTLPLRVAEALQRSSMVVANGQFFLMRRTAYFSSGGHEAIKGEVLDDLELARQMVNSGFRGGVAEGSAISNCRMYSNAKDLIDGYSKSQWRAFVNRGGALLAIALLFLTSILPMAMGLLGEIRGWYGYFAIVSTRLFVAARTRSTISSALLHPLSAAIWIYLIALSWVRKRRGALVWKERAL